jgi:nitrogen regulatory protein P-II 1
MVVRRPCGGSVVQYLVTAVFKPFQLEAVKELLRGIGSPGMTITEVGGCGRQGGHAATWRGTEYTIDVTPKVRIEVVADDEDVDVVVQAIMAGARTGSIGDGKIWVTELARVVRIRTGELGADAV